MWDKLRAKFMGKQETRVLVVGLDGAGKSTIVQRLKYGQTMDDSEVIPTIGFNIECVEYKKMIFSLWDLGGAKETRSFWRFYYEDTQAIIFVIDSSDLERMVREAGPRASPPSSPGSARVPAPPAPLAIPPLSSSHE